jgi:hypothetical protein
MRLISCENCGVIIDEDRIDYSAWEDEEDFSNKDLYGWDSSEDNFFPKIKCPVCKFFIFTHNGNLA